MKKKFAFLFAATLLSLSAVAQTTYPTKPVKLMVGAGAGGGRTHQPADCRTARGGRGHGP